MRVEDGQNIFDYCIAQTGDVNNYINIITLNDINADDDIQSGEEILLPDSVEPKEKYTEQEASALTLLKTIKDNQSIFDITIQYFGDIKYLFTLLNDNDLSLNSNLKSGLELTVNNVNFGNQKIKDMFLKTNVLPSNYQDQSSKDIVKGDYNNDYGLDHN